MNKLFRSAVFGSLSAVAASAFAAPPEFATSVAAANPSLWYRLNETSGNFVNSGSLGAAFNAIDVGSVGRSVATSGGDTGIGLSQGKFLESLGVSTLTGNPTFSIECLVRFSSGGGGNLWGPILHWGDGGANRNGKEVYFSIANNDNYRVFTGFYNGGLRMTYQLPADQWLHVVWTRQGNTDSEAGSKLYVNGYQLDMERDPVLVPGFFLANAINVVGSKFRVNQASDNGSGRFFTGALDELALYTRVLSEAEIFERGSPYSCTADLNHDAVVDLNDYFTFFNCFDATAPCADIDESTEVDLGDFFMFLNNFDAGC